MSDRYAPHSSQGSLPNRLTMEADVALSTGVALGLSPAATDVTKAESSSMSAAKSAMVGLRSLAHGSAISRGDAGA
eukprot:scaffold14887_cov123-Isochrysis_galbana.AAC.1